MKTIKYNGQEVEAYSLIMTKANALDILNAMSKSSRTKPFFCLVTFSIFIKSRFASRIFGYDKEWIEQCLMDNHLWEQVPYTHPYSLPLHENGGKPLPNSGGISHRPYQIIYSLSYTNAYLRKADTRCRMSALLQ